MSIFDKFRKKPGSGKHVAKQSDSDRAKFASVGSAPSGKDVKSSVKTGAHGLGDIDRVITGSLITEKALMLRSKGQYVFEADSSVNKAMVRRSFAVYYGVKPARIRMISLPGKNVRFGKTRGTTKRRKKVIVAMPKGTTIEM